MRKYNFRSSHWTFLVNNKKIMSGFRRLIFDCFHSVTIQNITLLSYKVKRERQSTLPGKKYQFSKTNNLSILCNWSFWLYEIIPVRFWEHSRFSYFFIQMSSFGDHPPKTVRPFFEMQRNLVVKAAYYFDNFCYEMFKLQSQFLPTDVTDSATNFLYLN